MTPTLLIAPFEEEVEENWWKWGTEGKREGEEEERERGSRRVLRSIFERVECASSAWEWKRVGDFRRFLAL